MQAFPSYKELFREVGQQVALNQNKIALRALYLYAIPILVMGLIFIVLGLSSPFSEGTTVILVFLILFVSRAYFWAGKAVFDLEKIIWVDSFFHGRRIHSKISWRIARQLFWPALKLRFVTYFKYYLVPAILFFISIIAVIYWIFTKEIYQTAILATILMVLVYVIHNAYRYFLRVKLSFIWFVFLDNYHPGKFELKSYFTELNRIGETVKAEEFKRLFLAHLGSDAPPEWFYVTKGDYDVFLKLVVQGGIKYLRTEITTESLLARTFGAREANNLARITATYLIYRVTRAEFYGQHTAINEHVYALGA